MKISPKLCPLPWSLLLWHSVMTIPPVLTNFHALVDYNYFVTGLTSSSFLVWFQIKEYSLNKAYSNNGPSLQNALQSLWFQNKWHSAPIKALHSLPFTSLSPGLSLHPFTCSLVQHWPTLGDLQSGVIYWASGFCFCSLCLKVKVNFSYEVQKISSTRSSLNLQH